jgi:hypothetical protein
MNRREVEREKTVWCLTGGLGLVPGEHVVRHGQDGAEPLRWIAAAGEGALSWMATTGCAWRLSSPPRWSTAKEETGDAPQL